MAKNRTIRVRLSTEEFERIKGKAEFFKMKISTYMRLSSLGLEIVAKY